MGNVPILVKNGEQQLSPAERPYLEPQNPHRRSCISDVNNGPKTKRLRHIPHTTWKAMVEDSMHKAKLAEECHQFSTWEN